MKNYTTGTGEARCGECGSTWKPQITPERHALHCSEGARAIQAAKAQFLDA